MYFPAAMCILFITHIDQCMLEHSNEQSLREHGATLVAVVTECLRQNSDLNEEFTTLLTEVYLDYAHNKEAVHTFWEFTCKLCYTRIQEFLDVHRQLAAKKGDGKHTLSG